MNFEAQETLDAVHRVLTEICGHAYRHAKIAAMRHVMRRLEDAQHYAPFMNLRLKTRVCVLVVDFLRHIGYSFTVADRELLGMNKIGVMHGLRRLQQVPRA